MVLDWKEYMQTARQAVTEGAVLLKNDAQTLPLADGCKLAVFGRMQNYYYKSGTGSGGMVNVSKVWNIMDGLQECGSVILNEKLISCYRAYDEEHSYDFGIGFGSEPWSQKEMPISEAMVQEAAAESEAALVIIARTAGEEQDVKRERGSYLLTETEIDMLTKVRKAFSRMIVLLNVGAVMDMNELETIVAPDAILYVWQGGMVGGLGIADLLTGKASPSGKLADTIAYDLEDMPAFANFGSTVSNRYVEDIYVGYRYYETFAKDRVRYPFGYGLSYTTFALSDSVFSLQKNEEGDLPTVLATVTVTNTGACAGKEVVQLYVSAPQGKLGKPARQLVAYDKTMLLAPGQQETIMLSVAPYTYASYDDGGVTGNRSCYVLEEGTYTFWLGNDVRSAQEAFSYTLEKTTVLEKLQEAMAPITAFERLKPLPKEDGSYERTYEPVCLATVSHDSDRMARMPKEIAYTGDRGISLQSVRDGKASMEDFIAQISDEDLACMVRGEGMGSPKVTPGTAAAFGGVSPNLKALGIPCGCCSDGPSGMRLDSGAKAFSLPNGTLLACTFNDSLNEELYGMLGMEMTANKVDVLLGPGMNIHRYVMNGRNFEYFSEDPLLTGKIAAAQIRGMRNAGNTGTLKHFCGNNQELNRHGADAIISERALREIYLKGFEIAVKEGGANSVMTTYGPVNGVWTNSRYDLNTTILRKEWGFEGIVMTDWWANIGEVGGEVSKNDFARLVRAQNDFFAVCPDGAVNDVGDNTLCSLANKTLQRAELQRSAMNICRFLMDTHAMKRMCGEPVEITVINREEDYEQFDMDHVIYYKIDDNEVVIPLEDVKVKKGESYIFAMDITRRGIYQFEITAKSGLSALSQTPVTCYFQGIAGSVFTWNGTDNEWETKSKKLLLHCRYSVVRLYFGGNGLELRDIRLHLLEENDNCHYREDCMIG